jgi:hypothetical protein
MADAIREQTRMIAEQNRLMGLMVELPAREFSTPGRMMNEHDLHLILMSDNIMEAIDRWNSGRKPQRGRR